MTPFLKALAELNGEEIEDSRPSFHLHDLDPTQFQQEYIGQWFEDPESKQEKVWVDIISRTIINIETFNRQTYPRGREPYQYEYDQMRSHALDQLSVINDRIKKGTLDPYFIARVLPKAKREAETYFYRRYRDRIRYEIWSEKDILIPQPIPTGFFPDIDIDL